MTMKKLAELCGVSVSTVSKAFSGSRELSEEKRRHIFDIAKKYGCFDKYYKGAYSGKVVAVICPEYKSGYYSELLSLFDRELSRRNALMICSCTDFEQERAYELLSYFTQYSKVDGIISLAYINTDRKFSVPIVTLGENEEFDSVKISEEAAVSEVIRHLKENGHRNIAFIGETLTDSRHKDFLSGMEKNLLPVRDEFVIIGKSRFEECGYDSMNKLLAGDTLPTAVIAAYDNIAFGAMKSITEHGLRIPDYISLVGFDNNRISPYLDIPLSSVTSYNEDLCEIMVNLLFEQMNHKTKPKKINIAKDIIFRASIGKNDKN